MTAGGSSVRVAVNLGLIYANDGEYAKAEAVFRRVLELWPDYPSARNNLADVLCREGKRAEGEAIFSASKAVASETRKEYPRTWVAVLKLARIRHFEHDDENALALLERARLDYPEVWEIIRFQSEVLRETKGPDAALRPVAEFVQENWWHHGANVSLGQLLWEKGDVDGGLETFRFASWLDVHEVEALNLLVGMHLQQNRLEEARLVQERAVSRQPDEPRQYLLLSDILRRMNRTVDADRAQARFDQLQALAHAAVAKN
jgi:tetratricopeptide (TPR) repeat protein